MRLALEGLATLLGAGLDGHGVHARLVEHPVGVFVGWLFDGDGTWQGGGVTVEQGTHVTESALGEQVDRSRALDVTNVDLDLAETVALDVEGLPARPQQPGLLGQRQHVALGGAGQPGGDVGQCGVPYLEQYVLRFAEHTLTGGVLLELEVDAAVGGGTDSEGIQMSAVKDDVAAVGAGVVGNRIRLRGRIRCGGRVSWLAGLGTRLRVGRLALVGV